MIGLIPDNVVLKMRIIILQTIGGFGDGGKTGGGVLHIISLAMEWLRIGNEVHFITNSSDKGESVYEGIHNFHRVKSRGHSFAYDMFANFFIQKTEIKSIIRSILKDRTEDTIVVAASSFPSDVFAAFWVARKFKLNAVVYFYHLNPPFWSRPFKRGGLFRGTVNWILDQIAMTLVKLGKLLPSVCHVREIASSGWRFGTGVLRDDIPLIVHKDVVNQQKSILNEACFIGGIAVNKGVIDLMRIWKIVCRYIPRAKLVIAGNLPDSHLGEKLYSLRTQLGLEGNVTFIFRYISEEKKHGILGRSTLFLFPSYEEGWSLSVMEAAAFGVLPITYNLPAYDYLGPNAVKVKIGDVTEFAHMTIKFIQETEVRIALTSELSKRVMSYTMSDVAKYQLAKFEQFLKQRRIGV